MHHPFKGINLLPEKEQQHKETQQKDQYNPVDRPGKQGPVDGTYRQLQGKSHRKKPPRDEEAYPWLCVFIKQISVTLEFEIDEDGPVVGGVPEV